MGKPFRVTKRLLIILAFAGLAVGAFTQTQTAPKPFEPTVGQPGKDVIWVPTAEDVVSKMLDLAKVSAQDYLIDLGSGDGRTVIAAAKRGARALGIEYNPDMVELSKAKAAREGVTDRVRFEKADIFESDFSQATVITLFLLSDLNIKLRPKILELKPGTRIVSNTFTMGEWESDETSSAEGNGDDEDYGSYRTALLWIVPARVAGTWQLGNRELVLRQTFQIIEGTLKNAGGSTVIRSGRLRGDQIHFWAGESEYTGKIAGNSMQGTVKSASRTAQWTAARN